MATLHTRVDICAIHVRILTYSEDLDAMVKRPLTSLGFTEDPASWSVEVERILTGISGSARLVAVQQICATAQVFRGRQLEKETGGRLADIVLRGLDFRTTLQMLTRLTSTNSESFDPECLNIIRSYLPELSQKVEAFAQDVPPLKTMQADLALSYSVLAMQRIDLDAGLNAWLLTEIPGHLALAIKFAIMQLSILVEERRAIVAVAGSLMSRVISRPTAPTQEDQAHVYEELRRLARALAIQVARQRLHLATIANAVQGLRTEFPSLRAHGIEVPVRELLAVRCKHSIYEGRLAAMFECSEHLRQMTGCMVNIQRLDADLASYKQLSTSKSL